MEVVPEWSKRVIDAWGVTQIPRMSISPSVANVRSEHWLFTLCFLYS